MDLGSQPTLAFQPLIFSRSPAKQTMSIEKVIVLGDDQIVRKNLEGCLRWKQCDVTFCSSIAAAEEYLHKHNFDIIFLDVHLPDADGAGLLRSLRALPQKPRAIIVTGSGNVSELQNVIERAVVLCGGNGLLKTEHSYPGNGNGSNGNGNGNGITANNPATRPAVGPNADGSVPTLAEMERRHILAVLEHFKGNRTRSAKILGVSIRTLRNKLHDYNAPAPAFGLPEVNHVPVQ
jgi:DNA-binding NtrC family response regulator